MSHRTRTGRVQWFTSAMLALGVLAQGHVARADDGLLKRGDAVVTGFSGSRYPAGDPPPDVHPLDLKHIDPDGVTVRILDMSSLETGPDGSLVDVRTRLSFKARDIGHVFGIAFDGHDVGRSPNIYLTATSVYGLHIVVPGPDGQPRRVINGEPGARFMEGLFGNAPGAGPGSIWRIDGRTGQARLLVTLPNGGAGLGAIAFDPRSRMLYVSDLESGLIHRLTLDGRLVDSFDHGVVGRPVAGLEVMPYDPAKRISIEAETFNAEDPLTWGFTDRARMVWGLAVQDGRLFYGAAEGPQVWSVGLRPDGGFDGAPRLEVDVAGAPAGSAITSITFDGPAVMYIAQRGAQLGSYDFGFMSRPQEAMAVRYRRNETTGAWDPAPEEYAVGMPLEHRGTLGGIALSYAYDRFGRIDLDKCRQTVWTTGEHLRNSTDVQLVARGGPRLVHGLQGNYKARVRPDNEPPTEAWFIDFDGRFELPETSGHVGNVAIYGPCPAGHVEPAAAEEVQVFLGGPRLTIDKACSPAPFGGVVACRITVRNTGDAPATDTVEIVDQTRILWGRGAGQVMRLAAVTPDGADWGCTVNAEGDTVCRINGGLFLPNAARYVDVLVDTRDLLLAGNAAFRNCVRLESRSGRAKACAEGGGQIVVEKTGPGDCAPGGECAFVLKVTNTSGYDYTGKLLVADSMFFEGQPKSVPIVSISPPLGCTNEPASVPFACVADIALKAGEAREHTVIVQMPAPGGYFAQNCSSVTDPSVMASDRHLRGLLRPVPAIDPDLAGRYPSCVWVRVPAEEAVAVPAGPAPGAFTPTTALTLLPPVAVCDDGRPVPPGGRCPCPRNAHWNGETGQCELLNPICHDRSRTRPDGSCCPSGLIWRSATNSCGERPRVCPFPERRRPDGGCCEAGTTWSWETGSCAIRVATPLCADGRRPLPNGLCGCPRGTRWEPFGRRCEPIAVIDRCTHPGLRTPGGGCCPSGTRWNAFLGRCSAPEIVACGRGEIRVASGTCIPLPRPCGFGTRRAGNGLCVPIRVVDLPTCGAGHFRAGNACLVLRTSLHPRRPDARPPRVPDIRPPRTADPRPPRLPETRPPRTTDPRPPRVPDTRPPRAVEPRVPRTEPRIPRSEPRIPRSEPRVPRSGPAIPRSQPQSTPRRTSPQVPRARSGGGTSRPRATPVQRPLPRSTGGNLRR